MFVAWCTRTDAAAMHPPPVYPGQVLLGENGMCFVAGRQFLRLHDVVEYYQMNKWVPSVTPPSSSILASLLAFAPPLLPIPTLSSLSELSSTRIPLVSVYAASTHCFPVLYYIVVPLTRWPWFD